MSETRDLLARTAELAADYVESLGERPVFPDVTPEQLRESLGGPLPDDPVEPQQVIDELVAAAEPGVVALGSGRYFGFVIGGALPAALAADWLTSAWDQNAGLYVAGPSASVVEQVDARVARRSARTAVRVVGRLRHRHADGARDRARGRSLARARRGRLGRRRRGPDRGATRDACSPASSGT